MANFNFKPVTNERAPNDTKSGVSSSSNSKFTFTPVVDKTPAQPAPKPTLGSKVLNAAEWLTAPIVKPLAEVATNAVNAVQIATGKKETQPFSGKYLGEVKGLGKLDVTKGFTPDNVKTFKKAVGTGAEIASTIGGGGIAKDAAGNIIKPTLGKLAAEGAGLNATYGLGQSLSENQGLGDTLKNVATQGAIGAVAGPVLGLAGRGISKLLKGKTPEVPTPTIYATEDITKITPGTERAQRINPAKLLPAPRTPSQIPIELPAPGILKSAEDIRNPITIQEPVVKTEIQKSAASNISKNDFIQSQIKNETVIKQPEIPKEQQYQRAIGKTREDFINSETGFLTRTKQTIPKNYVDKLSKIWEISNKKPTEILPTKQRIVELGNIWENEHIIGQEFPLKPLQKYTNIPKSNTEIPSNSNLTPQGSIPTELPKSTKIAPEQVKTPGTQNIPLEQQTPEFKTKVDEISNNIRQDTTTDFEHQTNQQQIAHVLSKDPNEVLDVALGKKAPDGGIPDTAYLAVAQNMADKLASEGDFSLVNKLSQSDIGRKAGQTLQALQIAMKNSVTGIVRDIRTSLEDKLPKSISKFADKEKQNIRENISKVIDTIDITKSSREDILLAVEKLMCK